MLRAVMETVASDADVDIIIVDELEMTMVRETAEVPVDIRNRFEKPVVMVLPVENVGSATIEAEGARRRVCDYYASQGLPVYLTLERAARALANFTGYHGWRTANP